MNSTTLRPWNSLVVGHEFFGHNPKSGGFV